MFQQHIRRIAFLHNAYLLQGSLVKEGFAKVPDGWKDPGGPDHNDALQGFRVVVGFNPGHQLAQGKCFSIHERHVEAGHIDDNCDLETTAAVLLETPPSSDLQGGENALGIVDAVLLDEVWIALDQARNIELTHPLKDDGVPLAIDSSAAEGFPVEVKPFVLHLIPKWERVGSTVLLPPSQNRLQHFQRPLHVALPGKEKP
mmetsp:Transcript_65505/g.153259  ORF Transcript_65505/g.153259 Transcript_65505/m.153259 type:complete len:201 (-) Transcript_65505:592-1194(-)